MIRAFKAGAGESPALKQFYLLFPLYHGTAKKSRLLEGDTMECTTNSSPLPRMRTISEASREIGIPQHTLRRWVKTGQVPAVYSGNRALLNLDRLIEFLGGAVVEE